MSWKNKIILIVMTIENCISFSVIRTGAIEINDSETDFFSNLNRRRNLNVRNMNQIY